MLLFEITRHTGLTSNVLFNNQQLNYRMILSQDVIQSYLLRNIHHFLQCVFLLFFYTSHFRTGDIKQHFKITDKYTENLGFRAKNTHNTCSSRRLLTSGLCMLMHSRGTQNITQVLSWIHPRSTHKGTQIIHQTIYELCAQILYTMQINFMSELREHHQDSRYENIPHI